MNNILESPNAKLLSEHTSKGYSMADGLDVGAVGAGAATGAGAGATVGSVVPGIGTAAGAAIGAGVGAVSSAAASTSSGDTGLDAACGKKPGAFANGATWKKYNDCKGAYIAAQASALATAAEQAAYPNAVAKYTAMAYKGAHQPISGKWDDQHLLHAITISGDTVLDHSSRPNIPIIWLSPNTFWIGFSSTSSTGTVSPDGNTLTWSNGSWLKKTSLSEPTTTQPDLSGDTTHSNTNGNGTNPLPGDTLKKSNWFVTPVGVTVSLLSIAAIVTGVVGYRKGWFGSK